MTISDVVPLWIAAVVIIFIAVLRWLSENSGSGQEQQSALGGVFYFTVSGLVAAVVLIFTAHAVCNEVVNP